MFSKRKCLTFCAAALALLTPILAACKSPDPESSAPTIQFLANSFRPDDIGVPIEDAQEFGVDLGVNGLRAVNKDVAFLFGGIRVPVGTMRSFLLRTGDGGKSWHEWMPPVPGSELIDVAFSDPQHIWALAQWAVEGPGAPLLFSSKDGGTTWRELTHIGRAQGNPAPVEYDAPLRMTFTSALKGEIELALANDDESTALDDSQQEVETLATDDGGVTWKMIRRETRKSSPVEAEEKTEAVQQDRGFDDTQWELVTRALREPITIRRFDSQQGRWRVTTLPTHFRYERGRVLASP